MKLLTAANSVFNLFLEIIHTAEICDQNDVRVLRFAGNVVEFGSTNSASNADCDHIRVIDAFQLVSLNLRVR